MKKFTRIALNGIFLALLVDGSYAATSINLREQSDSASLLKPLLTPQLKKMGGNHSALYAIKRAKDFNGTTHIRYKQTYNGYPVWRGDAVMHIPATPGPKHVNGTIYQNLEKDLTNTPAFIFKKEQALKAFEHVKKLYLSKSGKADISRPHQQLMVYVDKDNKAKWTYLISFQSKQAHSLAAPTYIVDAASLDVYHQWNNLHTADYDQSQSPFDQPMPAQGQDKAQQPTTSHDPDQPQEPDQDKGKDQQEPADETMRDTVRGGGFGGNYNRIQIYDGFKGNQSSLRVTRDPNTGICYMENDRVVVKDIITDATMQYPCAEIDKKHANTYWNEAFDATETGGISPANDALYAVNFISELFEHVYNTPVISDSYNDDEEVETDQLGQIGQLDIFAEPLVKPLKLTVYVHVPFNNAAYDPSARELYLGNGDGFQFYPFTSLTTIAHELSHGFTQQHAGFVNDGEASGLNESFSDMTAQIAEYAASWGKNRWLIGSDEMIDGGAFRYMDNPRKDCIGKDKFEICSVDNYKNYIPGMDGHQSAGIFNKAFYLLSTSKGWNVKKAFDVMIQANMRYWLPTSSFQEAACGVVDATKDYGYDEKTVRKVFEKVGLKTKKC